VAKAGFGKPVETGSEFPCRPDHVLKHVTLLKRELVDVFDVAPFALLTRGLLHISTGFSEKGGIDKVDQVVYSRTARSIADFEPTAKLFCR
jgi:hypothetical protein